MQHRAPRVRPSLLPSVRPPVLQFVRPPSIGLSVHWSDRPTVRLSVRPSVFPCTRPLIRPSVRSSVRPAGRLSLLLSTCPSARPSRCLSVRPFVRPSIFQPDRPPIHPSGRPAVSVSVLPFFYLSVRLSTSQALQCKKRGASHLPFPLLDIRPSVLYRPPPRSQRSPPCRWLRQATAPADRRPDGWTGGHPASPYRSASRHPSV